MSTLTAISPPPESFGGGGQASQAGDAVLLGSDLKIPAAFYEQSGGGVEIHTVQGISEILSYPDDSIGIVIESGQDFWRPPCGAGVFLRKAITIAGNDIPYLFPIIGSAFGVPYPSDEEVEIHAVINGFFTDNTDDSYFDPDSAKIYPTMLLVECNGQRKLLYPDGGCSGSW